MITEYVNAGWKSHFLVYVDVQADISIQLS